MSDIMGFRALGYTRVNSVFTCLLHYNTKQAMTIQRFSSSPGIR